jgi:hypothetical protein
VELSRSFVVEAAGDHRPADAGESPLSVDVLDRERQIIATRHLFRERAVACGGTGGCAEGRVPADREPYLDMADVMEWPEGASALSFHRGGDVVAVVDAGDPPTVSITEPAREDGRLVLEVRADHARATLPSPSCTPRTVGRHSCRSPSSKEGSKSIRSASPAAPGASSGPSPPPS